jgi:molybdenum cofactor synthesis domain-containing protein
VIPLREAQAEVLRACAPLPPRRLAPAAALRCVTAEPVTAVEDLPPFANSAMDGYALRAADVVGAPVPLRVVGSIMAGDRPSLVVGPGEAARIMTGAPLPRGADAICIVEHTENPDRDTVMIGDAVAPGAYVRFPGEDVAAGSEVFPTGTELTPAHVGLLARLGLDAVCIHPRPRVGVMSTGDEVVEGPDPLEPGRIRDGNRPSLLAEVREAGWEAVDLGIVGDDHGALAEAFTAAAGRCDAVLTSGGVSVGDLDMVRVVLDELAGASMRWMQVAIKPAKPFAFGLLGGTGVPVFGLPGNPVSALVSFELFARPALRRMAGHRILHRPVLPGVADAPLARVPDGKLHLLRVAVALDDHGALRVRPAGGQGSHQLRAMADANALALVPDGAGVGAGGRVDVLVLDAERIAPGSADGWGPT